MVSYLKHNHLNIITILFLVIVIINLFIIPKPISPQPTYFDDSLLASEIQKLRAQLIGLKTDYIQMQVDTDYTADTVGQIELSLDALGMQVDDLIRTIRKN